jgi:hypothetical protein
MPTIQLFSPSMAIASPDSVVGRVFDSCPALRFRPSHGVHDGTGNPLHAASCGWPTARMVRRAPPSSDVAMESLYRTGPGVHHATRRREDERQWPRSTLRVRAAEPKAECSARSESSEVGGSNQPDQREQRGHHKDGGTAISDSAIVFGENQGGW